MSMDECLPSRFAGSMLTVPLCAVVFLLAACATPPPDDDPEAKAEFEQTNDPLEPMNRAIFSFNDTLDTYALRPVAQGYRYVVPQFGRDRIANILANLKTPLILGNDLFEGDFNRAGDTLSRFALNSSFGVFGVMDVATPMGVPSHNADFGQTFAVWCIDEGPYLVLPLFGPSNPRDAIGFGIEQFSDPLSWYFDENYMKWADWTRTAVSAVSQREAYLDILDDIKHTSLDYYSAMRSLYRQHRRRRSMGRKPTRCLNQPADCPTTDYEESHDSEAKWICSCCIICSVYYADLIILNKL